MLIQRLTNFFTVICLSLLLFVSPSLANLDTYQTIQSNDKLNFTFYDENDKQHHIKEYEGKIVVLNVWATWCRPCVEEMPSLKELARIFNKNVIVLTLLENKKLLADARILFDQKSLDGLFLCYDGDNEIKRHLGVNGLPTTFVINPQGYIIGKQSGGIEWDHYAVIDLFSSYIDGKGNTPSGSLFDRIKLSLRNLNFLKKFNSDD